jgi:adenine-specific DNA-methyltransferase
VSIGRLSHPLFKMLCMKNNDSNLFEMHPFPEPSKLKVSKHYRSNGTGHVIFNGDAKDLLAKMPNESVQLVITSPPYNIGKEYETVTSLADYLESHINVIDDLVRVLKPSGSLCWQVGNFVSKGEVLPLDIPFYEIFKQHGLKLRNRIIWTFNHGLHASKRFSGRYETILWFTKTDDYIFNLDDVRVPSKYPGKRHYKGPNKGKPSGNPLGKNPSDLWKIIAQDWENEIWEIPNVKSNHPEKTSHPCQYPVELVQRCILALTEEGDVVLDPFGGVGSTVLAADTTGRRGFMADTMPEYCQLANQRISEYRAGSLKIRPLGRPVHQPTGREKVAQIPDDWK